MDIPSSWKSGTQKPGCPESLGPKSQCTYKPSVRKNPMDNFSPNPPSCSEQHHAAKRGAAAAPRRRTAAAGGSASGRCTSRCRTPSRRSTGWCSRRWASGEGGRRRRQMEEPSHSSKPPAGGAPARAAERGDAGHGATSGATQGTALTSDAQTCGPQKPLVQKHGVRTNPVYVITLWTTLVLGLLCPRGFCKLGRVL